MILHGKGMKET